MQYSVFISQGSQRQEMIVLIFWRLLPLQSCYLERKWLHLTSSAGQEPHIKIYLGKGIMTAQSSAGGSCHKWPLLLENLCVHIMT